MIALRATLAGFLVALAPVFGQEAATTAAAPEAPSDATQAPHSPTHVVDQADLLDERRERLLDAFLREEAQHQGIGVFLVTISQPDPKELPGELAARYRKMWFRPEGLGAVIVAVANPPRFAISVTSEAQSLPGTPDFRTLMQTWTNRMATRGVPAAAIRECAMDVAYTLRECRLHAIEQTQMYAPLRLAAIVGGALVLAGLIAYSLHLIHLQNMLGRTYFFPVRPSAIRLGGPMSGGHSASIKYGGLADRRPG